MNGSLELRLFNFIRSLHQEIVDMRPEDGFSSPRDIELVTEVNKKSAVFDKLQEAMRIYNPSFEYEPKEEGQKDFSKNPRFNMEWKEKARKFEEEFLNIWNQPIDATSIETLKIPYEFKFRDDVDIEKQIPSIIKEIKNRNVSSKELFLFNIVGKDVNLDQEYGNISYRELYNLFLEHGNINIKTIHPHEFKDQYLMILIKNGIRFLFKIDFEGI